MIIGNLLKELLNRKKSELRRVNNTIDDYKRGIGKEKEWSERLNDEIQAIENELKRKMESGK